MYSSVRLPSVGLSPDPVENKPTVAPFTGDIVRLPYMGPHFDDDIARTAACVTATEIGLKPEELEISPAALFERKVQNVAEMLECAPHEAEKVILSRM